MNMITFTLNLSKEAEKELEKDLQHLETITKKPREFHIKEALIRYIEDVEGIREIEKFIKRNKKPREYHIKEALIRYIEDMEDIRDIEKRMKNRDKTKYYTTEELSKRLGLDE